MRINLGKGIYRATVPCEAVLGVIYADGTIYVSLRIEGREKYAGAASTHTVAKFDAANASIGELIMGLLLFDVIDLPIALERPANGHPFGAIIDALVQLDVTAGAPAYVADDTLRALL